MSMRGFGSSVTLKAGLIGVIVLILLVPLAMLDGLISERSVLRNQAFARVAAGWGGSAVIGGPALIIPVEHTAVVVGVPKVWRTDVYVLPTQLDTHIDLQSEPEPRYVGIYAVPVYQSAIQMTGHFDVQRILASLEEQGSRILWNQARVRLPLSESRSLREVREARVADQALMLRPASTDLLRGVEASIDLTSMLDQSTIEFAIATVLAGSREFGVLPLGSTTTVTMRSDWPHPSFQGSFLPVERRIDAGGFQARWQVLELNRPYGQVWREGDFDTTNLNDSALRVGLHQTVDVYQRTERALKYALLFIALTFLTFFAWEQLSDLRLHPLQYLFVGLALSMFYVLLLALSEHIRFIAAYLIATVALVALMGSYISGALRSARRGLGVAAAMSVVYGLLYALILSEDYALLMGALTLFVALAALMIATRKVDWYRVGARDVENS